jgi:hypothetical protein
MSRHCARPGCNASAEATLTYDYEGRLAWIELLATEPHPMAYDLCETHADRLSVPVGWALQDRRARVQLVLPDLPDSIAS